MEQEREEPLLHKDGGYEKSEERSSRRSLITIIIIILLILLLFFWPVNKKGAKRIVPQAARLKTGPGTIGQAKYRVQKGRFIYHIGERYTYSKAKLVVLTFRVQNISREPQMFDAYMVSVADEGGRRYPVHRDFSLAYHEEKDKSYDLPAKLTPGAKKEVTLVFAVERAVKQIYLKGLDFNARSLKAVTLPVTDLITSGAPETAPMRRIP